jgi:hypothetical protein
MSAAQTQKAELEAEIAMKRRILRCARGPTTSIAA